MKKRNLYYWALLLFANCAFSEEISTKQILPPVVVPGEYGNPNQVGTPPSDAIVLFDGSNFDHWERPKGGKVKWKLVDGAMEVVRGTGAIQTKKKLGYGQYHVEWRTQKKLRGPARVGAILDSFPLEAQKCRFWILMKTKPTHLVRQERSITVIHHWSMHLSALGVWQNYDVIVHPPILDQAGNYIRRSAYTVLYNGVLIQDNKEVGGNVGKTGRLRLQDHSNPVQYRNIWLPHCQPVPTNK